MHRQRIDRGELGGDRLGRHVAQPCRAVIRPKQRVALFGLVVVIPLDAARATWRMSANDFAKPWSAWRGYSSSPRHPLGECAPDGGQIRGWELTGAAGLSEDESHGQAPFP
jgi:hypothetical protein